jgi:hypothetical protein
MYPMDRRELGGGADAGGGHLGGQQVPAGAAFGDGFGERPIDQGDCVEVAGTQAWS